MSAKTGRAPQRVMELAEAKKVNGVVMKLSPAVTPAPTNASHKASVPEGATGGGSNTKVFRDFAFQSGDFLAQNQRLRFADLVDSGTHQLMDRGVLALQVKHRNGFGWCREEVVMKWDSTPDEAGLRDFSIGRDVAFRLHANATGKY